MYNFIDIKHDLNNIFMLFFYFIYVNSENNDDLFSHLGTTY